MATEFERIKRAVEIEKDKKIKGEARISSFQEEETRIYQAASAQLEQEINGIGQMEKISQEMKEDIETKINEMKKILEEEGVQY